MSFYKKNYLKNQFCIINNQYSPYSLTRLSLVSTRIMTYPPRSTILAILKVYSHKHPLMFWNMITTILAPRWISWMPLFTYHFSLSLCQSRPSCCPPSLSTLLHALSLASIVPLSPHLPLATNILNWHFHTEALFLFLFLTYTH